MYCNEIRPYWLLITKGYGFTVKDIDNSCPADLEPYEMAYNMEQKRNDTLAWINCGNYVLSAVSVALEHCLEGKKAKSKYIESPVMQNMENANKLLSEEELQKQRELFVAQLEVMKTNFELTHKKEK